MWAHGGTTAVEDEPHRADLDTYVILGSEPDEETARRIEEAQETIARDLDVEWDTWYVLAADAGRQDPPRHAFRPERRDTSWAIHRAHWLAGRFIRLHGPDPSDLVEAPDWAELGGELSRELEHIERHVVEGDTDPYEATYAILNGSRILHAVETASVAISKREAGAWALDHLPARWHAALGAATRSYDGRPAPEDAGLLAAEMGPFVSFVRDRLPALEDRPEGARPRWSGG
jgi:aminoglycoside adenylyltransferase-like protein